MDVLSAEDFKNLVKAGKTAEVKSILRNIPPHEQFARLRLVNQDDPESGLRPLHWAASRGHGELASALAAAGAELEATTARLGSTALHYAASKGHAEVARRLLEAGAGVDRRAGAGEGGWTPLMAAAYWGRRAAVEVLLEKGADSALESTGTHENQFVGSTAADIANNRGHSGIGELLAAALKELRAQKVAALITKHTTVMGGAGVKVPADFDSLDPKKWHALKLNMVEEDFVQLRKNLGLEEELPPIPRENRVAFISHVKEESGAEARLLKLMLIEMLEGKFGVAADDIFLDTDHVHKMSVLVSEVKKTENILLLLTKSFLFKPWCLVELHTAMNSRSTVVPILVESLSGDKAFSPAMAARLAAGGLEERRKGGAPEGGSGGGRSVRVVAPGGGASAVAQNRWKRKRFMIKGPKSLLILTTALIGIFVSRTAYNIGSFLGIWQIPTIPLSASSDIGWDHFTIFLAWDFFPAFFGLLIVTGKSKHSSTPSATEMSSSKKSKQSGRNHHGRSRGGGGGGGGRRYAAHDPALYLDNISSPSQGPQKGPGGGGGGGGGGGPGSLVSYSLESDLESPMLGPVAAAVGAPAPRVQVQHAQGLVSYQTYPCPVKEGESILGANVQPQAYGSLSYDSGDGAPVYGNTGEMPSWMASLRLPQTAVYHNPRGHWAAAPPPPRAPLGGTAAAAAAAAATAGRPSAGGGGRVGGGRSQVRFANTNADPRVSSGRHGRQTGAGNHQQANAGYQVPQQQFRRPNNHQQATRSPQYQASSGQPAMFLPETQGTIGTSSNLSSMRRLSGDSRRDGQRRLSAGAGGGNFYNPPDPALHHHR